MPTNPMLSLLNPQASAAPTAAAPSSPDISGAVGLYKAYQAARNPIAALEQMAQSNSILAQLRQAQQGGTDMRGAFYALCQQQGVDPQTILAQFQ